MPYRKGNDFFFRDSRNQSNSSGQWRESPSKADLTEPELRRDRSQGSRTSESEEFGDQAAMEPVSVPAEPRLHRARTDRSEFHGARARVSQRSQSQRLEGHILPIEPASVKSSARQISHSPMEPAIVPTKPGRAGLRMQSQRTRGETDLIEPEYQQAQTAQRVNVARTFSK